MLKKLVANMTISKRLFIVLTVLLIPTMFLSTELVKQFQKQTDIFQSEIHGITYQIPFIRNFN